MTMEKARETVRDELLGWVDAQIGARTQRWLKHDGWLDDGFRPDEVERLMIELREIEALRELRYRFAPEMRDRRVARLAGALAELDRKGVEPYEAAERLESHLERW